MYGGGQPAVGQVMGGVAQGQVVQGGMYNQQGQQVQSKCKYVYLLLA